MENIIIISAYFSQSQQARINRGAFVRRLCGRFVLATEASFIETVVLGHSAKFFPIVVSPLQISLVFQSARNPVGYD